ncbi:MSHA biogenesis protein MshP [uncultured Shewanella sp.]|uniref:MSHA biogenesis protein MshP n=1 Tax=uncultured Shewanella sp. TaxID=173975 RepID=UPI0026175C23|nr:MSHA biogenesis protein MshP [uncultured Shewanella sp.]
MFLNHQPSQNTQMKVMGLHKQQGSALVIAVFVLIVMFLLAGTLIRMLEDGDESVNVEVWGARALFSANSAADAELAKLFPLSGAVGVCSANSTWTPPSSVGFHGCSVAVTCNAITVDGITQYQISSNAVCETGDCAGDAATTNCLRVNRQVEVEARGD